MSVINTLSVIEEVVISLRNADVLTTAERGVTRTTKTGSLADNDEIDLEKLNVKNVKSVEVGGIDVDYSVDYDTGKITLTQNYTDTYAVIYDHGPDAIFSGYPRNDLTINSFPRIAVEYISMNSNPGGFGNVNRNRHDISILVYDKTKKAVREKIFKVREWCINNQNSLSLLRLIKPASMGPLIIAGEFEKFKDKVMKQNFDFAGLLQYEVNN